LTVELAIQPRLTDMPYDFDVLNDVLFEDHDHAILLDDRHKPACTRWCP
jgi:hypothetical protein